MQQGRGHEELPLKVVVVDALENLGGEVSLGDVVMGGLREVCSINTRIIE